MLLLVVMWKILKRDPYHINVIKNCQNETGTVHTLYTEHGMN